MKKLIYLIIFVLLLNFSMVLAEETQPTNVTNTTQEVICNDSRCDSACVKCNDGKCHNQGFKCEEDLSIEKIIPENIQLGLNQINILLKNNGNVDLKNVYAKLSGDGIATEEYIAINNLPVDQKDYSFVKINASKSGDIDLIIKLYVDDSLNKQEIGKIFVIGEKAKPIETYNISELSDTLNKLKEDFKALEQDYQNKKLEGYPVDVFKSDLDEASTNIKNAQVSFLEENYKKLSINLDLASESINSLRDKLNVIKKQEKTLGQKVKDNLTYVAGIAAALVSILTAYRLSSNYVNKKKLSELHKMGKAKLLNFKQKEELKELETKEKKKKAKKKLEKKKKRNK